MILRIFKLSYFSQIALLISLTLVLWFPNFIKPQPILISESNIFTHFLFTQPFILNTIPSKLIGLFLLLALAFLLSHLFSTHQLTHRNNFLSGFLFTLFLSRTPDHLGFHPALIALLFLILGLKKLLENFKSPQSLNLLLTSSILFSLAGLFIPSIILLFPLIWLSLILFQSFSWRSIPISLIGLILPYFIIGFSYFWIDKSLVFIQQMESLLNSLISLPAIPSTYEIIELVISIVLLMLASSFILSRIGNQTISIRKKTSFMYWFLGFSILISFFNQEDLSREIVFIPYAAILGFYFSALKRQFWADMFISIVFLLILFQNYRILFYA